VRMRKVIMVGCRGGVDAEVVEGGWGGELEGCCFVEEGCSF
jgi:hypothetical protein